MGLLFGLWPCLPSACCRWERLDWVPEQNNRERLPLYHRMTENSESSVLALTLTIASSEREERPACGPPKDTMSSSSR